jgi:hypothetical protein
VNPPTRPEHTGLRGGAACLPTILPRSGIGLPAPARIVAASGPSSRHSPATRRGLAAGRAPTRPAPTPRAPIRRQGRRSRARNAATRSIGDNASGVGGSARGDAMTSRGGSIPSNVDPAWRAGRTSISARSRPAIRRAIIARWHAAIGRTWGLTRAVRHSGGEAIAPAGGRSRIASRRNRGRHVPAVVG